LILTNDGKVSLGHDRKRKIRAALKYYADQKLSIQEQAKLAGLLAFANDVERDFVFRMERKYGSELLRALKAVRLPDKQRRGIEFGLDDESGGTDSDDEF
jgi:RNA-directed DNA polymerase